MAKTAITPTRSENFPEWYQQVIKLADLAETAPVRGCMTIKPYGYAIWEHIQRLLDDKFKSYGVQNAYFPMLVPVSYLSREAQQVSGFAKECAVVTHHRLQLTEQGVLEPAEPLEEPYIIRPTSETIIGDTVAKWINSYRDLPLKINQWCNVMRWEMRTRLFLRTSEFLWHEGHAFLATAEETRDFIEQMWHVYAEFVQQELAIPAIAGIKTPEEKFPGAETTYSLEAILQDGKALQACTAHNLGQTFSKAFKISYLSQEGTNQLVYSGSWGLSTRIIGAIIMSHADDNGLCLPPAIAPSQIVIIPIIQNAADAGAIQDYCQQIYATLTAQQIRVHVDNRDVANPEKIWGWIKKGAPIRLEIGKRELEEQTISYFRRDDVEVKHRQSLNVGELEQFGQILQEITHNLHNLATQRQQTQLHTVRTLAALREYYATNQNGQLLLPLAVTETAEFAQYREQYALSRRCYLPEQDLVMVGKAY